MNETGIRISAENKNFNALMKHIGKDIFYYGVKDKTVVMLNEGSLFGSQDGGKVQSIYSDVLDSRQYEILKAEFFDKIDQGMEDVTCQLSYEHEDRIIHWVRLRATVVFDLQGNPEYAICAVEEITKQKQIEDRYAFEEAYRTFMTAEVRSFYEINLNKNRFDGAFGKDKEIYSKYLKMTYSEAVRQVCEKEVHVEDKDEFLKFFSRENLFAAFQTEKTELTYEYRSSTKEGSYIWLSAVIHMAKEPVTEDVKIFLYQKNIDEEKREHLKLQYKAERNPLTGLYNSAYMEEAVLGFVAENQEDSVSALLVLQVENLNKLQGVYGYLFKEKVLKEIVKTINKGIRADDITGDLDNGRFAIFLKNIPSIQVATERAKYICRFMETTYGKYNGDIRIWGSVAICTVPSRKFDWEELKEKADFVICEAMKQGRNRYAFYDENQISFDNSKKSIHEKLVQKRNGKKRNAFRRDRIKNWIFSPKGTFIEYIILSIIVTGAFFWLETAQGHFHPLAEHNTLIAAVAAGLLFVIPGGALGVYTWYRRARLVDAITGRESMHSFETHAAENLQKYKDIRYVMVFANIKMFTLINDQYGREAGNQVLRQVHEIIDGILEDTELSGRVRADKFAILMTFESSEVLEDRLEEISDKAQLLCGADDFSYGIGISYGVYKIEDRAADLLGMIDCASIALNLIPKMSRVPYGIYDIKYKARLLRFRGLENKMRMALNHKEFEVYLQPKYRLTDGAICGAEALVRWNDPMEGQIMPGDFIPLFERNGFVVQLDLYVFEETCKAIKKWMAHELEPIPIAVNISRHNLEIPEFLSVYRKLINKYQIPARLLEFEFTETMMNDKADVLEKVIGEIHGMGCSCAMDDFGSGYSSLNLLQNIDVDVLKMDGAFFIKIGDQGERHQKLIKSIIDMAKSLSLTTVAEGIEQQEQVDYLREMGCDYVQGFIFSKAIPISEFEKLKYGNIVEAI